MATAFVIWLGLALTVLAFFHGAQTLRRGEPRKGRWGVLLALASCVLMLVW